MYAVNLKQSGTVNFEYYYPDSSIIFEFFVSPWPRVEWRGEGECAGRGEGKTSEAPSRLQESVTSVVMLGKSQLFPLWRGLWANEWRPLEARRKGKSQRTLRGKNRICEFSRCFALPRHENST